jgi:GMP synthase (glutamine-hydrolysing)
VRSLREDTARHGPVLERAARAMFGEWLDRFAFGLAR